MIVDESWQSRIYRGHFNLLNNKIKLWYYTRLLGKHLEHAAVNQDHVTVISHALSSQFDLGFRLNLKYTFHVFETLY
jgi:hypothetical protein